MHFLCLWLVIVKQSQYNTRPQFVVQSPVSSRTTQLTTSNARRILNIYASFPGSNSDAQFSALQSWTKSKVKTNTSIYTRKRRQKQAKWCEDSNNKEYETSHAAVLKKQAADYATYFHQLTQRPVPWKNSSRLHEVVRQNFTLKTIIFGGINKISTEALNFHNVEHAGHLTGKLPFYVHSAPYSHTKSKSAAWTVE